jgi:hypothetical protein
MSNILDLSAARLAKVKALADAENYALVQTGEGYELRCPFNARPQFAAADLGAVERFLISGQKT